VSPKSDQIVNTVDGVDGLVDGILPASELSRRVDVVRLNISSEMLLRLSVEFDHSVGEVLTALPETDAALEHGLVEGTEDLLEGVISWEIDQDQRTVPQETRVERFTADVGGRVAGSHELYPFQRDPLPVSCSPEAMLLGKLPEEGDDSHRRILVSIRQIDLIAEDHQPLAGLLRSQHDAAHSLVVLAVMLELLHDEARVGRRGEVYEDHLEFRKGLEG
jgi:hypothetical protein